MEKALHERLAAATKARNPQCPSDIDLDPDTVEVAGMVPPAAQGLYALKHELIKELQKLEWQMAAIRATMESADRMAESIVTEAYPEVAHRKGIALCANWQFFAFGPDQMRVAQEAEKREVELALERERRRAVGEPVHDVDEPCGEMPRGLREALCRMMRA